MPGGFAAPEDIERRVCRWCSLPVPKPRRTFCSEFCVDEWKLRTDPGYMRERVLARDKGICAMCGLDTLNAWISIKRARWERRKLMLIDWGLKSPDPSVPVDYFTGKLCGMLRVEKAGNYTFMSKTDDHIDFAVDGHRVLVNDSNAYVEGKLTLTAGDHPIRIYFREDGGGACLSLKWKLEGAFDTQEIPASALWHEPQMKEQYQKPGK